MIQVELYPSWPQSKYSGATNLMTNFKRVLDIAAAPWGETAKGMTSQEATTVCIVGEEGGSWVTSDTPQQCLINCVHCLTAPSGMSSTPGSGHSRLNQQRQ